MRAYMLVCVDGMCKERDRFTIIAAVGDSLEIGGWIASMLHAPTVLYARTAIEQWVVVVRVDRVVKLPSYVVPAAFVIAVVPADEDCND